MKPLLTALGCILFCVLSFGQEVLKGRVTASDTRKPVPLANVFLSNTSIGTVTTENGEFTIHSFPEGRYDLVVSFVGYETQTVTVQSGKLPSFLEITIIPKVNVLQEVVVEPYEKNGWEKWGKFFLDNFIGTSLNARDCKLLNQDAVKFRFRRKENKLEAHADETLLIENKALGYRLKYDLTRFDFDFNTRMFFYQGYPLFEEIATSRNAQKRRWDSKREETYYGSLTHFMRSLYRNQLIENHFEVRRLLKIPETEKKRVRDMYRAQMQRSASGGIITINGNNMKGGEIQTDNSDSAAYYRKVMQSPEDFNVLINQVLPGDSIAYGVDSVTAGFHFSDYLQVTYTPKKLPDEYKIAHHVKTDGPLSSELVLTSPAVINILANGSYFEGTNLLTIGYWAWSEKVANLLPFDYWPARPAKK